MSKWWIYAIIIIIAIAIALWYFSVPWWAWVIAGIVFIIIVYFLYKRHKKHKEIVVVENN